MRYILFCLPLVVAADLSAQSAPACGEAARTAAPDTWDAASAVSGDFTLDGKADVAFWRREDASIMVYIAECDGERALETWRFRIPLATAGSSGGELVQAVSPLLDPALLDRVCSAESRDECAHLRAENGRRQVIADAGGRELRIGAAGDSSVRLRWSREHHGFMRIGG